MRAWTCHGRSQRDLVDKLWQAQIVQSSAVAQVLQEVDRANYIAQNPYQDAPQAIGQGQTISAPHMHAHVLEEIYQHLPLSGSIENSNNNLQFLDVGCGSGYLTAALGRWLQPHSPAASKHQPHARVFGIDVHASLVEQARRNMRKADGDLLDTGMVQLLVGDGWKGLPDEAPFDAIHVGAAADGLPHALAQQLKVGGVLIIPIGRQGDVQTLYKLERLAATAQSGEFAPQDYKVTNLLGVRYVPLVHPEDEGISNN